MDSGEDIICKILKEFKDAFVVERPMSIKEEPQFHEELGEVVNQTGLHKWMNFTQDITFIIPKQKVMTIGTLAPEVTYFYKTLCQKMIKQEEHQLKTVEEVSKRMKDMGDLSVAYDENKESSTDNILPFQVPHKSKLH
jgi:hypothetical protein